ncbi:sodium:proton antiporter [Thermosphaera sp.]
MSEDVFTWSLILIMLFTNTLLSIYGIVYRRSLTKKLIALTILSDTANVVFILIGFRFVQPAVPPVLTELSLENLEYLKQHAVDPLPQALVLTGIVISMAVNALIAFGIIQAYRITGSTDARIVVKHFGEEVKGE